MQSRNKASLAYLCALTLLFSYAEMILPRVVPFFRLGLANTVILLALDINFGSFVILSILKATAASLIGGTLFSPFFLISLVQSLVSALVMRFLHKFISKKAISLYGISGTSPDSIAWYTANSTGAAHYVMTKAANGFGVYDLNGNVWEWCYNPWTSNNSRRAMRGGSYRKPAEAVTVVSRDYAPVSRLYDDVGFRVVKTTLSQRNAK